MANGEKNHKFNFPDDDAEVYPEQKIASSMHIGMCKTENKMVYNGCCKDEEAVALVSDTLARNLIVNGEQNHKLNFPNSDNEKYQQRNKRKRLDHEELGFWDILKTNDVSTLKAIKKSANADSVYVSKRTSVQKRLKNLELLIK